MSQEISQRRSKVGTTVTVGTQTNRLDLYEHLARNRDTILEDARHISEDLGLPEGIKGRVGPSGSNSALPGTLRRECLDTIEAGMLKVQTPREIGDDIRRLVKSVYGDGFDAAPTNSCESALQITYDALFTPPVIGSGESYRSRVIGLIERHAEHHLSYGRPFPPRYKDIFADRGATAGELGLLGRAQNSTDCIMVPMVGARYELHGIKMHASPLLVETDARATVNSVAKIASIHSRDLTGFITLGYDTIGHGCAEKTPEGAPVLLQRIGALAANSGLPYVSDNAWGTPFLGTDPRAIGADVMLYSMDKVGGAPTSGLVIGKEWPMVNIRRALGIHSERFGSTSAHGKAAHVHADPGKMTMLGLLAALRTLRDKPEIVQNPIDETHEIVCEEYERARGELPEGIVISKSYNLGGVELNYERTWRDPDGNARIGIPIFTNEDRIAGSHLLAAALQQMGVLPGQSDDGNIIIDPGLGTVDEQGQIIESHMRPVVRAVFRALILLYDWAERHCQSKLA
jgi:hypothetical protein